MILLRAILLFFVFITPLKANTIYNLIKIPNLEIYKIDTENGLRYLYAAKPFRLGIDIKKNINCFDSNKKTLDEKYKIVKKNLDRYSLSFLKKINLKYIVLCENLSTAEINTAGIPNNITRTLILDIKFNEKHFERAIHHELFHIINDNYKKLFNENIWKNFNKKNFEYSKCSTCGNNWNLELLNNNSGFFTEYAKSTASEDMAEVFSHLIFYQDKINSEDPIIKKKILFIKNNILKIDNNFNFWNMINKIKTSKSEKIILCFVIILGVFTLISLIILKNKCLFVKNYDPNNIEFNNSENIVILNATCGNVIIELYPNISPMAVKRFKKLVKLGAYDDAAFHRVIEGKLIQAGDLEFGKKENLDYGKVGSGKSGLGTIKSELDGKFKYDKGSVGLARTFELNTEDSQFFIILQDEPLFEGEYTPVGKVLYGLEVLEKVKFVPKFHIVPRPDFINSFKMFN